MDSALVTYLPIVQLAVFVGGWCAAMLTGLIVLKVAE